MNAILFQLKQNRSLLFEKYPVKEMALFGSYSRGDFNEESDVDILVEFSEPDAMKFIMLANELEDLLGKKVDLVSKKGIKPNYFCFLQNDLQYV